MRKPDLYQLVVILLTIAIIVAIGVLVYNFSKGKIGKTAVKVDILYGQASVLVNGKDRGQTPIPFAEVPTSNVEVEVNGETNSYKTSVTPAANTLSVISRDLGVSDVFSSGVDLWFTKTGRGDALLSFISPNVSDVAVIINDVEVGKTPVKVSTKALLSHNDEEKYAVTFKKDGYDDQTITLVAKSGHELTSKVDLFLEPLTPVSSAIGAFPDGVVFIGFSNSDNPGYTNRQDWAKAINYWLMTRGAKVIGNNSIEKFNYFIADDGKVYNETGNEIAPTDMVIEPGIYIAYLGSPQTSELTNESKNAISLALGEEVTVVTSNEDGESVAMVKIEPTGLGFLRVRSGAGRDNAEVAKVEVGKSYKLLGEEAGWYKIEYVEGEEGWISATYAVKVETEVDSTNGESEAETTE